MAEKQSFREQIENLSDRERKLLFAMVIILPLLAMIVLVGVIHGSLSEVETQTMEYRQSLEMLSIAAPTIAERKQKASGDNELSAKFTDEAMRNNELKLTSFVATQAAAVNISVDSYDEQKIPLGSNKEGPMVVEKQLRVDINEAEMDKLLKLLERIETAEEPVVIKRLDLRRQRRNPGEVRVRLVVSTFVKQDQKS